MKHNTGATNLAGSLGGESESILSEGFSVTKYSPDDGMVFRYTPGDDDSGSTYEGDLYERRTIGIGRPRGTER